MFDNYENNLKTKDYENNLKIKDLIITIDFDSLKDEINPYDIQRILNYRETNHKDKLTFVISDTNTVQEMYDILGLPCYFYKHISVIGKDSNKILKENFQEYINHFKSSFICMNKKFLKKCKTKDVSRTVYTITNNGITLVKKAKEEHNDFHMFNKKENDVVNRPAHYANRKYEPINVISSWKLDFLLGNVVKYISRLGLKDDPKQDINKALFYLIYKCKKLGLTQEEIEKTVKQIFSM